MSELFYVSVYTMNEEVLARVAETMRDKEQVKVARFLGLQGSLFAVELKEPTRIDGHTIYLMSRAVYGHMINAEGIALPPVDDVEYLGVLPEDLRAMDIPRQKHNTTALYTDFEEEQA